ncbi:glycosyltransferase family 39 protein [Rathayibacter sp. ZW T2_19]|uniref:Glycosyltransferase family 39 protein n=1 Tax=Rathayibacter rubneri TaxID=2950106 RepID=A0A9X2IR41_9MICO|nr:glycosyltransferase family 39 protein [Rathayibacter rubneri]MCM6761051.1 glycosyltransferase family 39 protein [Rathayibacter rubneri]
MTAVAPTSTSRRRARLRLVPWWARVLAVFVLTRLVTTVILLQFAANQAANSWTGPSPSYSAFASMWDGRWYEIIALSGYPSTLPVTEAGEIGENAWAFMPLYPAVVRLLMLVTGLGWAPAAVTVSVVCGAVTSLVLYRLLRHSLDETQSLVAVLLFCVAPTSPLLQLAYAESAAMMLTAITLLLLVRRRYALVFPVVLLLGLTRPSGLAFAAAMGLYVLVRFLRRSHEPFERRDWLPTVALTVWGLVVGFLWPIAAWAVTGSITAYTDTELAWRSSYIGYQELFPFTSWFQGGAWWGQWWFQSPAIGIVLVVLLAAASVGVMASPWVRRLDLVSRAWIAGYAVYLFAFFFPQSSTFRLLGPMFPLVGALAVPRSPLFRVALVLAGIGGQILWISACWAVDGYDWTPP